jgi:hypothetical protein
MESGLGRGAGKQAVNWKVNLALGIGAAAGILQSARADEALFSERTPGRLLAEDASTGIDVEWRNFLIVRTNSSDLPSYTRRTPLLVSAARAFGQWALSQRFNAQTEVYGAGNYLEESEEGSGPSTSASTWFSSYGGQLNLSLLTSNDISVFGGAEVRGESARTLDRDNSGVKSTTEMDGYLLWRPRFGLIKNGPSWHAGVLYGIGDEKSVRVTTEVLGDKREEEEFVLLAPRFGGFFSSNLGGQVTLGTEIDIIMGSDGSMKSGGKDVFGDSYRAQVHTVLKFSGSIVSALWLSLAHETLSYADQDFVTFETIPHTSFESTVIFSSEFYLGSIVTYGNDVQSTDEINRSFQVVGFGLRTGYKFPMK